VGPLFYTSYASVGGDSGPVQRFHADVQREIHSRLGPGPRAEGRLKPAEPGAGPDPAALTCRSMLALYSAEYLRDARSARDWAVFHERMERRRRRTGEAPRSLVGVLWRTDGLVLPRVVAETGRLVDEPDDAGYQGSGVLGLLRAGPLAEGPRRDPAAGERYRGLVRRVASLLTEAARRPLPELPEDEGREVAPRFGPLLGPPGGAPPGARADAAPPRPLAPPGSPAPPVPSAVPPPLAAASGPAPGRTAARPAAAAVAPRGTAAARPAPRAESVLLVLVAGTRARMSALRRSTTAYGDTPAEWRPFRPSSDEPAVAVVRRTLRDCGVERLVVADGAGREAAEPDPGERGENTVPATVLVLVDPWLSTDTAFPAAWDRLAARVGGAAAVIVVLARDDEESGREAARLREAFMRGTGPLLGAPHHEVASPDGLAHTVAGALADAGALRGAAAWPGPPDLPPAETPEERLTRRRSERARWTTRVTRPGPAWFAGPAEEAWSGG
jgi:FxsC-like protein